MLQSVIRVGNSLAVTLPKRFVNGRKVKAGQKLFVEDDIELGLIQIRAGKVKKLSLTPEFKEWLDEVSVKHESLIKELAKR